MQRKNELRRLLLHDHPSPKSLSIHDKRKVLNEVLEYTLNDAEQGSVQWRNERELGGSDTASIMGKGYYGRGLFDVVRERIFGSNFSGNIATRMGRIMEDVPRKIIEKIFNTTVHELKSLPNQLNHTSYSPDGVAVLKLFNKIIMVLLEFKVPLSRIPDGKIPREYLPQIKSGMCALPMVDGSLFVNSMLRICPLRDFSYNLEYNTKLHKSDLTTCKTRPNSHKSKLEHIYAFGLSIIVQNKIQRQASLQYLQAMEVVPTTNTSYGNSFVIFDGPSFETKLLNNPGPGARSDSTEQKDWYQSLLLNNEVDYGNESESTYDRLFSYIDEHKLVSVFTIPPFVVNENLGNIELLKQEHYILPIQPNVISNEMHSYFSSSMEFLRSQLEAQSVDIVGCIPYKIFKMDIIYQPNDEPLFIKNLKPFIDKYAEIKEKCSNIDRLPISDEEKNNMKWNVLYEHFPDKKPTDHDKSEEFGFEITNKILNDDSMF